MTAPLKRLIESRYGGRGLPVALVLPDGGRIALSPTPEIDLIVRSWPGVKALAQNAAAKGAPRVSAFLEIRADSTVLLRSPFAEGGQGVSTALAQIVGEELDVDPASFTVECAPPGADYLLVNGNRFTGGSYSVRSSYDLMRRVGASARQMLLQAAAARLRVPLASLSTEPGRVRHAASNRTIEYGALAVPPGRELVVMLSDEFSIAITRPPIRIYSFTAPVWPFNAAPAARCSTSTRAR